MPVIEPDCKTLKFIVEIDRTILDEVCEVEGALYSDILYDLIDDAFPSNIGYPDFLEVKQI